MARGWRRSGHADTIGHGTPTLLGDVYGRVTSFIDIGCDMGCMLCLALLPCLRLLVSTSLALNITELAHPRHIF